MGSHDGAKEHFTTRLFGRFVDISSAEEVPFVVDGPCTLEYIRVTIETAITTADATITVKNLANDVLATLVHPFTDSAAGDSVLVEVKTIVPLAAGDFITVETDGGSTVVSEAPFVVGLLRD
jgi:hypothetical protein